MYSTHCVKCTILEDLLKRSGIDYEINTDTELMLSKGFDRVPVLEVDGECLDFDKAVEWITQLGGNK